MTRGRWFGYAPLLGVLFVVLVAAGFIIAGDTPDANGSVPEIKDAYDSEGKHQLGAYLVVLGAVALLFFAAHLRGLLRILDPFGRMANAAFGGAIVSSAGFMIAAGFHGALAETANEDSVSGQALQALNALDNWSFFPFALGLGVMVLASGIVFVRARRGLPAGLGWTAIALGILQLTPLGFFAFLLSGLWVLIASIVLYTQWDDLHRDAGSQPTLPGTSVT